MRVSADHYAGRRVKEIEKNDEGYSIVFDGDATINVETDDASPTHDETMTLLAVTMSSGKTTLVFSNGRVELPPQGYSIVDEAAGISEPIYPQRNEDWRDLTVPEEPKERITE